MKIEVKLENGIKTINGQTLHDILQNTNDNEVRVATLSYLFNNVNSDQELIIELKKLKSEYTPVAILFYLKLLTKGTIADVNDYFQKILES